jgi:hypothetical protein
MEVLQLNGTTEESTCIVCKVLGAISGFIEGCKDGKVILFEPNGM